MKVQEFLKAINKCWLEARLSKSTTVWNDENRPFLDSAGTLFIYGEETPYTVEDINCIDVFNEDRVEEAQNNMGKSSAHGFYMTFKSQDDAYFSDGSYGVPDFSVKLWRCGKNLYFENREALIQLRHMTAAKKAGTYDGPFMTDGTYLIDVVSNEEKIHVPKGIQVIGPYAFKGLKNLREIVLPEGVNIIDNNAFFNCSSLKKINFPDSLISIGSRAFMFCKNLQNITFPDSLTALGEYAFCHTNAKQIIVPENVNSIGKGCFSNCASLQSIILPNGLTKIDEEMFWDCGRLSQIILPCSLTSLGGCAFEGCGNLEWVLLPTDCIVKGRVFPETCQIYWHL